MTRVDSVRDEIMRLIRAVPFQPFVLTMESGDRILIDHPENIAFDPTAEPSDRRSNDFYVLTRQIHLFAHFDAVTSIATADCS